MKPSHLLTHYLDLRGPEASKIVAPVIESYGPEAMIDQLRSHLNSEQESYVVSALALMRDVLVVPVKASDAAFWENFRSAVANSTLFERVYPLLCDKRRLVRTDVVYTLGKIYWPDAVPHLLHALPTYERDYPDELLQLIQELIWLIGVANFEQVEQLHADGSPATQQAVRHYFTETFALDSLDKPLQQKYLALIQR